MIRGLLLGMGTTTPTVPTLIGVVSRVDGVDPVPSAHAAGNLLVNGACNNNTHSGVAPNLPSPWTLGDAGDSILGSTNRAAAFFQQIAASSGQTGAWSNANIPRAVWAFSNAAFDKGVAFEGTGTSLTWPSLTALGMASDCIVCAVVMARAAQTSMATAVGTPMASLGFTQRTVRNSAPAVWVGDTDTTLLSAFAPAAQTFDTGSNGFAGFVFSVKVS